MMTGLGIIVAALIIIILIIIIIYKIYIVCAIADCLKK